MLKDPECRARYEESLAASNAAQDLATRTLNAVRVLQEELKAEEQVPMEPVHRFSPGLYTRELTIPAETFVIGKTHRHSHPVFFMKGKVLIRDVGVGGEWQALEAPGIWISQAGAKRILFTVTECVFATCHASDQTDVGLLEDELIVPEDSPELDHFVPKLGTGG